MVRFPRHRPRARGPFVLAAALTFCAGAVPAAAQMELAVIQGTVVDQQTDQPLPDVTIRLRDLERGRETVVKTNKNGRFYRRGMQAVVYAIAVSKAGYKDIQDTVNLRTGVENRYDFELAAGTPAGAEEFQQGVAAYNSREYQAAATAFEAAIQKQPKSPDLYVNLAVAYYQLKRTADAVAQLEKAASLARGDPRIQYLLGSAYVDVRQYDKAVAAFEKGLATNPDLASDPLALAAASTLGAVYFAQGQNAKAEAQFQAALAAKPGAAAPTLALAKIHFSKGEEDRALELFKEVIGQHPGSPEAAQAEMFIEELRKGKGGR